MIVSVVFWGCDILDNGISLAGLGLSEEEVVMGLKEALEVGTDSAVSELSLAGGYANNLDSRIPIPLPDTVTSILSLVDSLEFFSTSVANNALGNTLGGLFGDLLFEAFPFLDLSSLANELVQKLNEAAEAAAHLAAPIFVDAITGMTIADGFNILNGTDTAATTYLKDNTFDPLVSAYTPKVDSALRQVQAVQVWEAFSTKYNELVSHLNTYRSLYETAGLSQQFSIPSSLPTNLSDYTTEKALSGLFIMVGKEETRIRENPLARVTELLKKVFGST
jgi:hypothetical protein